MEEHRTAVRNLTFKGAKITFSGHGAAFGCVVRNLSISGACLKVESPIGIPAIFDLVFEDGQSVRPCRVIWRKGSQLGVEFQ